VLAVAPSSAIHADPIPLADKQPSALLWGLNSNAGLDFERLADDFELAGPARVTDVSWYGYFADGRAVANFDVLLFEDAAGLPEASPLLALPVDAVSGEPSGVSNPGGYPFLRWTATVPALDLPAAGRYWISVQGRNEGSWFWAHSVPDPAGGVVFQNESSDLWEEGEVFEGQANSQAFLLVPEPDAHPLGGLCLASLLGLSAARRRLRPIAANG
jgi:hypothetical protein